MTTLQDYNAQSSLAQGLLFFVLLSFSLGSEEVLSFAYVSIHRV